MDVRAESHLSLLAQGETSATLAGMGFAWARLDGQVAAALRFKRAAAEAVIVGLVGGASSGKSTIFNALAGGEVSRISAHAHETLGPVAAVGERAADRFVSWIGEQLLFPGLKVVELNGSSATSGAAGAIHVYRRGEDAGGAVLVDLPDVTSKMSADEGALTRNLLPWFDGLLVVVDEERWFDAAVFDEVAACSGTLGARLWVVFNRTERSEALTEDHLRALTEHATSRRADAHWVCPYSPGSGYRPVSAETRRVIESWINGFDAGGRAAALEGYLRRRCAALLAENVTRGQQFNALRRGIDEEVAKLTEATRLSADLLTGEERRLLGLGHRFVPLYDVVRAVRRWLGWSVALGGAAKRKDRVGVDFEKSVEDLAEVLRRNLEHRFRHATARIDRVIVDSAYLSRRVDSAVAGGEPGEVAERTLGDGRRAADGPGWKPTWSVPAFDEREWAVRIRAHIEAWKAETIKQARAGDVASVALGAPLLLMDLLFLGGAGMTLAWTATWLAGFLGGKGLVRAFQRSPAFQAYRTTVGAYQAFLRESLNEQCEANLAAMPRRHLAMSDPVLRSVMAWSSERP